VVEQLLEQIEPTIIDFVADKAYDKRKVYNIYSGFLKWWEKDFIFGMVPTPFTRFQWEKPWVNQ
jgi:hypothetical protein